MATKATYGYRTTRAETTGYSVREAFTVAWHYRNIGVDAEPIATIWHASGSIAHAMQGPAQPCNCHRCRAEV